jgi:hypothetical protein
MIIVGKQGCSRCKKLRTLYPKEQYIEIPNVHIGLGDTICAITCFFGITPCKGCMIRRHWCNKWIPYKWNLKKIAPEIAELKQRIIISNIKQYPVFMDNDLKNILPIESLPGYINDALNV